jgi:hypothetical protein
VPQGGYACGGAVGGCLLGVRLGLSTGPTAACQYCHLQPNITQSTLVVHGDLHNLDSRPQGVPLQIVAWPWCWKGVGAGAMPAGRCCWMHASGWLVAAQREFWVAAVGSCWKLGAGSRQECTGSSGGRAAAEKAGAMNDTPWTANCNQAGQ